MIPYECMYLNIQTYRFQQTTVLFSSISETCTTEYYDIMSVSHYYVDCLTFYNESNIVHIETDMYVTMNNT